MYPEVTLRCSWVSYWKYPFFRGRVFFPLCRGNILSPVDKVAWLEREREREREREKFSEKEKGKEYIDWKRFRLVGFYDIPTFVGYLMPNAVGWFHVQDTHWCRGSYPSAEMQLVYSTAPADRVTQILLML